jgi:hypothetical protein
MAVEGEAPGARRALQGLQETVVGGHVKETWVSQSLARPIIGRFWQICPHTKI